MKVSVALATYNSTKYIREQLDSIRNQSEPVDEVVIVDDCSSDETVELLEKYIKDNDLQEWKLFRHIQNKGYIQTFTDALVRTSGDIVILCDHDDLWIEDKVKLIKKTFAENDGCLALATSFIQIDANGNVVHIKQKRHRANNNLIRRSVDLGQLNHMTLKDVAVYNISPGCTCAIRRTTVTTFLTLKDEQISDSSAEKYNCLPHDWKLNIIAAAMDGLYYLDVPTTKYRIYSSNTIGLGHQLNYEKRKAVVGINCDEKREAAWIVGKIKGQSSKEYSSYKVLEWIFLGRKRFMETGNILSWLRLMVKSIGYSGLYESIAMDIMARAKR